MPRGQQVWLIKLYTYSTEAAVLLSSRGDKISTYLMGKKYSGRKISSITSICCIALTWQPLSHLESSLHSSESVQYEPDLSSLQPRGHRQRKLPRVLMHLPGAGQRCPPSHSSMSATQHIQQLISHRTTTQKQTKYSSRFYFQSISYLMFCYYLFQMELP